MSFSSKFGFWFECLCWSNMQKVLYASHTVNVQQTQIKQSSHFEMEEQAKEKLGWHIPYTMDCTTLSEFTQ